MSQELLRFAGLSIGVFDERNYYVAEIKIAGKGAQDAGQERLEKMHFYANLPQAMMRARERVEHATQATSLKGWAEALEKHMGEAAAALDKAAEKFMRAAPKLKRDK